MKLSRSAALALAGALLATTSAQAEPVKLRAAWVATAGEMAVLMAFKTDVAKHWNKSYSLEAIHLQGTPSMITALAANEIELAPLAYSTLGLAIVNAHMDDLRIIADDFRDGTPGWYSFEFMVLNDGPVKTIADLKGKTLATNSIGAGPDIAMEYMLFKNHFTRPKDFTVIEAAFPNMNSLLLERKVDLISDLTPFALDPKLRAAASDLFTQRAAVGGETQMIWVAHGAFLQKNRAAVVDFLEDYLRIMQWYFDPPNRPAMVKIVSDFTKVPLAIIDKSIFNQNDFYRDPKGLPNIQALQANVDMAQTMGVLKQHLAVAKYADLSYIQAAAKRLE